MAAELHLSVSGRTLVAPAPASQNREVAHRKQEGDMASKLRKLIGKKSALKKEYARELQKIPLSNMDLSRDNSHPTI